METIRLRSRRDPSFWVPLAVAVAILISAGLAAHSWTAAYLEQLQVLAKVDSAAALQETVYTLKILGILFFAFAAITGVLMFRFFQLGLAQGRLPPAGVWSIGAYRAVVGRWARIMSQIGIGLNLILPAAGIGSFLHILELIKRL